MDLPFQYEEKEYIHESLLLKQSLQEYAAHSRTDINRPIMQRPTRNALDSKLHKGTQAPLEFSHAPSALHIGHN